MLEFLATTPHQKSTQNGENLLKPADLISTMSEENRSRFLKLWDAIDTITAAEFDLPFEPDNRSVSHHLQLVIAEYERWLGFLEGDIESLFDDHELTSNIPPQDLHRYWNSADEKFRNFFYRASEEDLHKHLEQINGPMWEALIHLLMRAEEHHNYIITILANLGKLPHQPRANRDLWQFKPETLTIVQPAASMAHWNVGINLLYF